MVGKREREREGERGREDGEREGEGGRMEEREINTHICTHPHTK